LVATPTVEADGLLHWGPVPPEFIVRICPDVPDDRKLVVLAEL